LLFLYSVCGFPLFVTILSQVVTGYTEFVEWPLYGKYF
jgi:hypothetical protein